MNFKLHLISLILFIFTKLVASDIVETRPQLTNSTLYTLCRNSDLYDLLETIINYEDRFNSRYHYDWVFLNDAPFDDIFKLLISNAVSGNAKFGLISKEMWSIPKSVDENLMNLNILNTLNDPDGAYPYADSISYRNMCRFESGFFYNHPLLLDYDYFWRIEPGVKLHCDIKYDIFKDMIDKNQQYGFTIGLLEYPKTVLTLFNSLYNVLQETNQTELLFSQDNYSKFIFDSAKNEYNMCHFWTNFEIGNLNIFRSEKYNTLFEKLDGYNGFYYERWGDAPIKTLILSLILKAGEIRRFDDIGYQHDPYLQCPKDIDIFIDNRCSCDTNIDITDKWFSCSWFFDEIVKNFNLNLL